MPAAPMPVVAPPKFVTKISKCWADAGAQNMTAGTNALNRLSSARIPVFMSQTPKTSLFVIRRTSAWWASKVDTFVAPLGNLRGGDRIDVTVGIEVIGNTAQMLLDGHIVLDALPNRALRRVVFQIFLAEPIVRLYMIERKGGFFGRLEQHDRLMCLRQLRELTDR